MLGACQSLPASSATPSAARAPTAGAASAEFAKPPATIFEDAEATYEAAGTYHIRAAETLLDGTRFDHDLSAGQGGVTGQISINGVAVEVLVAGGGTYLKGAAYLREHLGVSLAGLAGEGWFRVGGADAVRAFTNRVDRRYLCAAFPTGHFGFRKSMASLNGQPVIKLTGSNGNLYVAAAGRPYPLRLEQLFGGGSPVNSASNDWSDYELPVAPQPPAAFVNIPASVVITIPAPLAC